MIGRTEDLLGECRAADSGLAAIVESVLREEGPYKVVPAAGVVGEAMMALVLAEAFLEKFAGDGIDEVRRNYQGYLDYLKTW